MCKQQLTCAVRNLEFHGNVSSCRYNEEFKNIILTAKSHSLDTLKHTLRFCCIRLVHYSYNPL
jgi:hypothetical protein